MKTKIERYSKKKKLKVETKDLNEEELKKLYNDFNQQYFSDKLPHYRIKLVNYINRYDSYQGMTYPRQKLIRIVNYVNKQKMISILLHEMVHAATNIYHGKRFMKKMEELRNAGVPIGKWEINPTICPKHLNKSYLRNVMYDTLSDIYDLKKIKDTCLNNLILVFVKDYGFTNSCAEFLHRYPWIRKLFNEVKKDVLEDIQIEQQFSNEEQFLLKKSKEKNEN